jgi:hypothetical protein
MVSRDYKFLKLALHKRYFDQGFGVLNYIKYPLMLLGFAIPNTKYIIIVAILYAMICYFLGWWWLNKGMQTAETEISNKFNPFVAEMREIIDKRKI